MGIIGIKQKPDNTVYIGNFYVHPKLGNGWGPILEYFAYESVEWCAGEGEALLHDISSMRHIEKGYCVGVEIKYEVSGQSVQVPILLLKYDKKYNFESRRLQKEEVIEKCGKSLQTNKMSFFYVGQDKIEEICNIFFMKGYCLARMFFGNNNMRYIVFEKME